MNRDRLLHLYKTWLSDEGHLGLHLVIGFVVALAGGILFVEIADELMETEDIQLIDLAGRNVAELIRNSAMTRLMKAITFIGELWSMIVFSIVVGLILFYKHSRRRLYTFVAIMGGGGLLNAVLKLIFARDRPLEAMVEVPGYSFPSGHAMGAALFFGALGYVLFFSVKRHPFARTIGVGACVIAAFLIGFSRIYLGVHYTSDVIAGFVGGITWTAICIFSTEAWIRWRDRRIHP